MSISKIRYKNRPGWRGLLEGWRKIRQLVVEWVPEMLSSCRLRGHTLVAIRLWDLKVIARRGLVGDYVFFPELAPLLYSLSTGSSWILQAVPGSDPAKTQLWDPRNRCFTSLSKVGVPLKRGGSVIIANALTGGRMVLLAAEKIEGARLVALLSTLPDRPDSLDRRLAEITGSVSPTFYGEHE
jgi:hypothetical protein